MPEPVIAFKTIINALFLFWFIAVVLMSQKLMSNNKIAIKDAGMLWLKTLSVVLLAMLMLIGNLWV